MTVSGAMTKARSHPAYGRKRKEKWRRGTNVGKRCLSRSVSVENLELYSLPNGCCKASSASSFSPDLAAIFQLSDISRELSFGFPFLLREKKRGDSGRTGRASLLARTVLLTVFFGYKPRLYPGFRVENRVTPYQVRDDKRRVFPGSRIKCGMTGWPHRGRLGKLKKEIIKRRGMCLPKVRQTKAGIPWIPHQVRDDSAGPPGELGRA